MLLLNYFTCDLATQSDNFGAEANLLDASQESVDEQSLTAPVSLVYKDRTADGVQMVELKIMCFLMLIRLQLNVLHKIVMYSMYSKGERGRGNQLQVRRHSDWRH